VPPEDVIAAFEELKVSNFMEKHDDLVDLLMYFEVTGRKRPLFAIECVL